jgi:hypothetical protein
MATPSTDWPARQRPILPLTGPCRGSCSDRSQMVGDASVLVPLDVVALRGREIAAGPRKALAVRDWPP